MSKLVLRKKLKLELQGISDEDLISKSKMLSNNLLDLINTIYFQEKRLKGYELGGFSPIQREPVWFSSFGIESRLVSRYSVVHMHNETKLSYHYVAEGILENKELKSFFTKGLRVEKENPSSPDIIIVPGLGFTRECDRIGRGRGYFDSFLKDFQGISIGVGFESQLVENVYSEAHDKKLDYLITEKNIFKGIQNE